MKKSEIKISFDADKLAAVKQYMEKKDADISLELEETIGKLYEKYVPAAVREYIEFNTQSESEAAAKAKKPPKVVASPESLAAQSISSANTSFNSLNN